VPPPPLLLLLLLLLLDMTTRDGCCAPCSVSCQRAADFPLALRACSPLPQDKPDYFDAEGTVKWNAWNAIAHMAKETAAQRYIAESKRQRTPMSQR